MNSGSSTGLLFSLLKTRDGAPLLVAGSGLSDDHPESGLGAFKTARSTPSTMSSMYVKARHMCRWVYTSIGRPSRIASEKRTSAMSGRPHVQYTVKKRSPVVGRMNS